MTVLKSGFSALLIWGSLSFGAFAFQETTVGGEEQKAAPAPVMELPKAAPGTKGLEFSGPALNLGKTQGTEVRIPGIGTVGVLPKLDFGLELLYGANEPKGIPQDQSDPGDVQIRGTIKHRF